nr:immunoglobulin heavy chain junction region [Macaca mulatta]MOW77337.1 immunoglobulin heavy chain junction region [Macaca mulatta]MOW77721.1 immunoglobulin heavy chain junction region [Macaca mulatta]MOW78345.1 immunoglobulin heavy chain junction region [Macaca mulatta]MOW78385.1 immunoglobulin heavy chain junction region [Macaca mulatta]
CALGDSGFPPYWFDVW